MRNWKQGLMLAFCLLLVPLICVGNPGNAPDDAGYVVMSLDATLTADHVLTAGDGITVTDGASTVTVAAEWKDDATSTLVPVTANDDVYVTTSNDTYAIQGDNTQSTGSSVGVYGSASGGSTDAVGVSGSVNSTATTTYGGKFTNSDSGTTDYGVYGSVTTPGNSDYSVYANEWSYTGKYVDYWNAHAEEPMTAPTSGKLRVYAHGEDVSRLMARTSSSEKIDLSIQADDIIFGQYLATGDNETWDYESIGGAPSPFSVSSGLMYTYNFTTNKQTAGYGIWDWTADRQQMAMVWRQCRFATGGQIDWNDCDSLTLRAKVLVNCVKTEGALPSGTYWDSIKFYVTENTGNDATISSDIQGETVNGAWRIIDHDFDVSGWTINDDEALMVGLVFVGEEVEDPGEDPETIWTYEVKIEWIHVIQWIE